MVAREDQKPWVTTACDCCHCKVVMSQKEFDLTYIILCKSCEERELHSQEEEGG